MVASSLAICSLGVSILPICFGVAFAWLDAASSDAICPEPAYTKKVNGAIGYHESNRTFGFLGTFHGNLFCEAVPVGSYRSIDELDKRVETYCERSEGPGIQL